MTAVSGPDRAWLDQLDALRQAATPGEWVNDSHELYQAIPGLPQVPNGGDWIGETCRLDDDPLGSGDADAALIVAAVNSLPSLLAAARERDALRAAVERLCAQADERVRASVPASGAETLIAEGAHTVKVADLRAVVADTLSAPSAPPGTPGHVPTDARGVTGRSRQGIGNDDGGARL